MSAYFLNIYQYKIWTINILIHSILYWRKRRFKIKTKASPTFNYYHTKQGVHKCSSTYYKVNLISAVKASQISSHRLTLVVGLVPGYSLRADIIAIPLVILPITISVTKFYAKRRKWSPFPFFIVIKIVMSISNVFRVYN